VRQGKRTTTARGRIASGLALAVAAALGAAGCTSSQSTGATTAATTSHSSPHTEAYRPQLTLADARAAYAAYVTTSDLAARTGDEPLALSVLMGAAADTLSADYKIAHASRLRPPYTRYTYGTPTYYLAQPSSAGNAEYFVVSVARSPVTGTTPMVASAQDVAGDVQLPPSGTVLMLFEKPASGGAWQVASISELTPGEHVPALATDDRGYVAVDEMDVARGQLVRPALAPPLQASVVDDGPASPAAQAVASGPLTTGLYDIGATSARGIAPPPGDVYQWLLEGASYGRLSLRAADGGSLVLYTMYFNLTVQTKSSINQNVPVLPGPPITVPAYVKPLLSVNKWTPTTRLETQDVLTFAAIDPPATEKSAKIQVIAVGGGLYTALSS
jgi:hypothetical protein